LTPTDNHLINFFFDLTLGCRPTCLITLVSQLFGRFLAPVTGVTKERIETTIAKIRVLRSKIQTLESAKTNGNGANPASAAAAAAAAAASAAASSREWFYVMDLMLLSCCVWLGRLQIGVHLPLSSMSHALRIRMVHEITRLIQEHRALWSIRSRMGGLEESSSFLERVRDELSHGLVDAELMDWRGKGTGEADVTPEKKRV
jgi:hypothetical protein